MSVRDRMTVDQLLLLAELKRRRSGIASRITAGAQEYGCRLGYRKAAEMLTVMADRGIVNKGRYRPYKGAEYTLTDDGEQRLEAVRKALTDP